MSDKCGRSLGFASKIPARSQDEGGLVAIKESTKMKGSSPTCCFFVTHGMIEVRPSPGRQIRSQGACCG